MSNEIIELDNGSLEVIKKFTENKELHPDFLPFTTYDMAQSGYPKEKGVMIAKPYGGIDANGKLLPSRGMWCKVEDVLKIINNLTKVKNEIIDEDIMHGSVGIKLEDLVGKVLKLTFIIHEMEKRGGGHESVYYEKVRSYPPDTMTMIGLGYHDGYADKKLLLINDFYIKKSKEETLELVKKDVSSRYGGYKVYELTNLKILN